jgi:Mrp family chromosome partitioning ATPase
MVLGATVGFAIALLFEVAKPRISDLQEAERVTGARVLAVIRPREIPPDRARRKADLRLPPLIDPTSDAYRLLASHASVSGTTRTIVTVTGDVPAVNAIIAANIAAVSANEMRGTLLVDADLEMQPLTSVLRLPSSIGIAPIHTGDSTDLAAAVTEAAVGRDRWLDVAPAGDQHRPSITAREAERLRDAIARAARHYELTVVVSPLARVAEVRVAPDVLVCAQTAHSLISTLRGSVAALRDAGAQIIGIVLWSAEAPGLEPPWIFENWFAGDNRGTDNKLAAADH